MCSLPGWGYQRMLIKILHISSFLFVDLLFSLRALLILFFTCVANLYVQPTWPNSINVCWMNEQMNEWRRFQPWYHMRIWIYKYVFQSSSCRFFCIKQNCLLSVITFSTNLKRFFPMCSKEWNIKFLMPKCESLYSF